LLSAANRPEVVPRLKITHLPDYSITKSTAR
jgi:hypothetical protein